MRSSFHFLIICGPAYFPYILGKQCYERNRTYFAIAALFSYVLHPGGGLYRDAVMINAAEHTGLDAFNLFVRLLVGSRTLFWLILVFGYELPPEIGVPMNAAFLLTMSRLRPSQPFCATMQTPSTQPLFHIIASSLPLITSISQEHPQLSIGADVCNPLIHWMQFSLGFLLPALVHLASDYSARMEFVRRHPHRLTPRDRATWQPKLNSSFSPWPVAAVLFVGIITIAWYAFIWPEMMPVGSSTTELLHP